MFTPFILICEEKLICKTNYQSGLNNLGGDHKEILSFLGLNKFNVDLSRTRKSIYKTELENLKKNKNYIPKSSHFIEILITNSKGRIEIFECTWIFNIKINKINEKNFSCLEKKNRETLFSLEANNKFVYSSKFSYFNKLRKNSNVYHSLFGECGKNIKK